MRKLIYVLLVLALLVTVLSVLSAMRSGRARKALAAYKTELRAQGEKLTFDEAGYPFPLEKNANLEHFVVLANKLDAISGLPGRLDYYSLPVTGRLRMCWRALQPPMSQDSALPNGNVDWKQLVSDCEQAAQTLTELRAELEHPPRYFGWDFEDPLSREPKNPFVEKRKAAYFLCADAIVALRRDNLPVVQSDLHALTQLARVHRDDPVLVSAMIQTAIAGLGLSVTWQALPAEGWDDASLLVLQRDWESIDLVKALETGLLGERLFGVAVFNMVRDQLPAAGRSAVRGAPTVRTRLLDAWLRSSVDADELRFLQQTQAQLASVRRLATNASGVSVVGDLREQRARMTAATSSYLGRYAHLIGSLATPNCLSAFGTTVRMETERRLTITAIALKRFHLGHGRYPGALSDLVPAYLTAELLDPWSGKPFCYRLSPDDTYILYSVGEDGHDDGGDATSDGAMGSPQGIWHGKDAVWPTPVFPVPQ